MKPDPVDFVTVYLPSLDATKVTSGSVTDGGRRAWEEVGWR